MNVIFRFILGFGLLGNSSRRYSTFYIPIVVRRSRSLLENVFPAFTTSHLHVVVPITSM